MSHNSSHINHIAPSLPTSVKDRLRSEELHDGWVKHVVPHNGATYLHNPSLNLVMLGDVNPSDHDAFVSLHRPRQQPLEMFVHCVERKLFLEVNHAEEMAQVKTEALDNGNEHEDRRRARYWTYISHYPCHYELPSQAKSEALFILELMELQNLVHPSDLPRTPFSASEINDYTKFLQTKTSNRPTRNRQPPGKGFAKFCSRFYALVCLQIIEEDSRN
ncbi:hypothetical protein BYT27DRAFT_6375080 [Phlegmacium glaucopus]|nr:hypothetical protein BYT27DRAFT_6375080 [Phlegmacium glaucopus]